MRYIYCLVAMGLTTLMWGFDALYTDNTVDPAQDFYQYANGGWMRNNTRPDNISRYNQLSELDNWMLARLTDEFASGRSDTTASEASLRIAALLQRYYAAGMRDNGDCTRELNVLASRIEMIRAGVAEGDIPAVIARLHMLGVDPLFRIYDPVEWQVPDIHRLYLRQPYVNIMESESEASLAFNAHYRDYLAALYTLSGFTAVEASERADAAIRIERQIVALLQPDPASPWDMFNKRPADEFVKWFAPMDFGVWLQDLDVNREEKLVIDHPAYFQQLAVWLQQADSDDLTSFLTSRFLTVYGRYMHGDFRAAREKYYRDQYGLDIAASPGVSVVEQMTRDLPEHLNEFYLDRVVTQEVIAGVREMAENIRAAWIDRVASNDWMGNGERKRALRKLAGIEFEIGGQSQAEAVSRSTITDDILCADDDMTYIELAMLARRWRTRSAISRIGQPWDRSRPEFWSFSLDFHYMLFENRVIIGGGNIQSPSYTPGGDLSANYGGIGTRVGHEISHAIDSQGRRYNENGKPLNKFQKWGLTGRFGKRCEPLIQQFNQFHVDDDCYVNGKATLMENLADLGGILAAWDGLLLACQQNASEPDAHVFLVAYAQKWRELITDEQQRMQCRGPHAPTRFRVNGPLQNVDLFYETFGVQPGDAMYLEPEKRTSIW